MLSQTAEYALRAVLFLADRGGPATVDEIAERVEVPRNYLSKTLHRLAREGVLASSRGKGGGFRLAVDPHRLTLLRVVEPFHEVSAQRRCLLGRPQCNDRAPRPAHHQWRAAGERISEFFRERTVGDLVSGGSVARRRPEREAIVPQNGAGLQAADATFGSTVRTPLIARAASGRRGYEFPRSTVALESCPVPSSPVSAPIPASSA